MKTAKAAQLFGNYNRMAKALGVTRQAISQWGETVPPLRAYQIEEILAQEAQEEAQAGTQAEEKE